MKKIAYLILLISCLGFAQEAKTFPEDYYGIYKGDLEIYNPNGKKTIQMEFHLKPSEEKDKYHYTLVYVFNENRQERKYTLVAKDKAKGIYEVDENNGIILHAQWLGNGLYSMYEVGGTLLTTTERFYDDHMDFEIMVNNQKSKTKTGGVGEDIPEVNVYPISAMQKARLIKQKD